MFYNPTVNVINIVNDIEQRINTGTSTDNNRAVDKVLAEMPESIIPLRQRKLFIENGIIAQDVEYQVIQDHGQMAPDDHTFFQIRLKFGCSNQYPSLSTVELQVAAGDNMKLQFHPFLTPVKEFVAATRAKKKGVEVMTTKASNWMVLSPEQWLEPYSHANWKSLFEYDYDPSKGEGDYRQGNVSVMLFINVDEYRSVGAFKREMIPWLKRKRWWLDSANGPTQAVRQHHIEWISQMHWKGVYVRKLQDELNNRLKIEYWVNLQKYMRMTKVPIDDKNPFPYVNLSIEIMPELDDSC